jgi:magnesium transporter
MRRAIVSTKEGVLHPVDDAALVDAMKATEKVLWLDVTDPDGADTKLFLEGFGFHPLSIEDLRQTHSTAKLDEYENYVFQVVMVPFLVGTDDIDLFEVEIFYTKGTLVTCHDRPWKPLDDLWASVCRDPARELGLGAQRLYHSVVDRAVNEYFPILDQIEDRVEGLETEVFEATSRESVLPKLFHLRRSVRHLLRAARNQRESVQRLAVGTVQSLRRETCYQFRDVHDHLILLHDSLDDHRETLGGLRDTYLGVISNRMNEVMKSLTVFSVVLLPLAFLTGLFGMNVPVPFQTNPWGFWLVLGLCAGVSIAMLLWIGRRGWLRRIS